LDFAKEIVALTETNQKIVFKDLPKDDPKQRKPDITRASDILKWKPKVDRQEGLKITLDYFQDLPEEDLYKYAHPKTFD
jgi:dTDP-glucose 4,6-dehydratase